MRVTIHMKILFVLGCVFTFCLLMIGLVTWAQWMVKLTSYIGRKTCWFRHDWNHHQYSFAADSRGNGVIYTDIVIAFKVCKRCAKSKLVHILR
jgi:hypothetical protein